MFGNVKYDLLLFCNATAKYVAQIGYSKLKSLLVINLEVLRTSSMITNEFSLIMHV